MTLSSESLNMPFLNTSFESEAPILNRTWHSLIVFVARVSDDVARSGLLYLIAT